MPPCLWAHAFTGLPGKMLTQNQSRKKCRSNSVGLRVAKRNVRGKPKPFRTPTTPANLRKSAPGMHWLAYGLRPSLVPPRYLSNGTRSESGLCGGGREPEAAVDWTDLLIRPQLNVRMSKPKKLGRSPVVKPHPKGGTE